MSTSDRTRWLGLAVLSLGVSMIIVDATIVNVALPSIIREFDLALADAEWINSIYSLVFAALLITVGKIGDITGRRRMFMIGLVVFVAASMVAGRSGSPRRTGESGLGGRGAWRPSTRVDVSMTRVDTGGGSGRTRAPGER